jgi:phage terminase small subunit
MSRVLARLLAKASVSGLISEALKARSERTFITADRVLTELAKIGFADIRKAVQWGKGLAVPDETGEMRIANGVAMIDSSELDDQTAAAIAEVAQTRDGIKIKFHDKRAALMDIGRHLGMFKERVEMTGKDSGPLQVETSMHEVAKLLLSMIHEH